MEDKEKADCLIELHKEQLGKFKQSRSLEFKINLTFWSSIVLAGYYIKKELVLKPGHDYCLFWIVYLSTSCLLLLVHYFFWMRPMQKSQKTDDYYINQYRKAVEKLTAIEIPRDPKNIDSPQNWAFFEVCITAFLLIVVAIYIVIPVHYASP